MTITLLQQDILWNQPLENQLRAERLLEKAPRSGLYVLPEMWSTGFATQPQGIAERDGASLQWMKRMAHRFDAALAGSIAVEEDGAYFNRFYFVTPDGRAEHYDKHHLFTYGGEHQSYTAGQERKVVEWQGVRFLLQICYDVRFPIFSRNFPDGNNAYDVALYVASWPASRQQVWDTLLKARAMENQCYVCGVNRIGSDMACTYLGGTVVIDAYGQTVASCPSAEEVSVSWTIDMEQLRAFRKKFPVLNDRD